MTAAPAPVTTLPLIDISPFLIPSTSAVRVQCAAAVHAAILEYGFFLINGLESVLSTGDLTTSLAVTREFFAQPAADKAALSIQPGDGARGYQRLSENVTQSLPDHHEALDIYREFDVPDSTRLLHGPNLLPDEPAEFKPMIRSWTEKCKVLGMALMEATAMGLGLNLESDEWNDLKSKVVDSFWVMRCIGYPQLLPTSEGISCGAHCDYGCWTLLHADDTKGALQVFRLSKTGASTAEGHRGDWIAADPVPNALVVNIGSMWETWTNGLYRATLHRVEHKGKNFRVSMPFFYEPDFDAVISPIKSLVLAGDAVRPSVVYGDFLSAKVLNNFAKY